MNQGTGNATNVDFTGTFLGGRMAYPGTSGYVGDGVEPNVASVGSTFTFRIKYSQAGGVKADQVQLVVNGPGVSAAAIAYAMVGDGTTDWETGVVFSKDVILRQPGAYQYQFIATTGTTRVAFPKVGYLGGLQAYAMPVLSWLGTPGYALDGVSPDSDGPGAPFTFGVKYAHAAGTAPANVRLHLRGPGLPSAGATYDMTGGGAATWVTGVVFTKQVALTAAGSYLYCFTASDGARSVGLPVSGWQSLPTVTPARLRWAGTTGYLADGVAPDTGGAGALFTFKVKYSRPNGVAPTAVRLWLWRNGALVSGGPFPMAAAPGVSNWQGGVIFACAKQLPWSGSYAYRFVAYSGATVTASLPAAPTNAAGPVVGP